jgi:hypothetical protein
MEGNYHDPAIASSTLVAFAIATLGANGYLAGSTFAFTIPVNGGT